MALAGQVAAPSPRRADVARGRLAFFEPSLRALGA